MFCLDDLIVAPATPAGAGARGIVRIAGQGLPRLLDGLLAGAPDGFAASGPARLVEARLAGGLGERFGPLPIAVLHWPGPAGPVGGPLAELQLPAADELVAAVVREACALGGRLARGGEFTLRAFLAGRLDLLQAEAVLAVVDARSPAELSAALDRLAGGVGRSLAAARDTLLDLLADVEAAIDFADETTPDAVPAGPDWAALAAAIEACDVAIADVAAELAGRARAAEPPRVVLVGPPNVGKSSLFNALVGRAVSLVADERGTTRDHLEAELACGGGPACVLVDLAGVDAAAGGGLAADVQAGLRAEVARADVVVACRDAAGAEEPEPPAFAAPRIDVTTRVDLMPESPASAATIATSSVTGAGLDALRAAIAAAVAALPARATPATARLAAGCDAARAALAQAAAATRLAAGGGFVDESLLAGHLRRAAEELSDVTGAAVGDDLLDRVFARHCIGK